MRWTSPLAALAIGFIVIALASQCSGKLQVNYYKGKCQRHDVEKIMYDVIEYYFKNDTHVAPELIRLLFHDCAVRGCDASILLDGPKSEKESPPNLTVGGYAVVDAAKEAVENVCPGVVSCADVLVIATRSAVFLAGGKWYNVETGRRDGFNTSDDEAKAILPRSEITADNAIKLFATMNLTKHDFVVLMGAHTVGIGHCENFENRIFNFKNTTHKPDKRIPPSFLKLLKSTCPTKTKVKNETFLDQTPNSGFKFDNGYYKQLLANKGLIEVDANIATSELTYKLVKKLAFQNDYFLRKFGPAMVKMSRYGVLTGNKGEIRKTCGVVNK